MESHQHGPNCGCKQYIGAQNSDDLFGSIHLEGVKCLNEKVMNSGKKVFKPYENRFDKQDYVSSQDEAQLLLIIPFTSQVKIKSICLIAKSQNNFPNKMKLYLNEQNADFTLIQNSPVQQFILNSNLSGQNHNAVKQSKFNRVDTLVIYLKSTIDDLIEISYIQIKGQSTGLKRQIVKTVYELQPNAKKNDFLNIQKNHFQMQ